MIETFYAKTIIQNLRKHGDLKERLVNNLKEHMHIAQHVGGYSDFLKNYQLDLEFHRILVMCTENSKIIQIHKNLGTHVYGNYIYGRQSIEEIIPGVKEHELIFNALADEDEVKLRNALEAHIMNAKIRNKKLFSSRA